MVTLEPYKGLLIDPVLKTNFYNNRINIICVAATPPVWFNFFIKNHPHLLNFREEKVMQMCQAVNNINQAGTLFPPVPISLLPLSRYGLRDDWSNMSVMQKNMLELFVYNSTNMKTGEMLFVFERRPDFNNILAENTLVDVTRSFTDITFTLQKTYFITV